VFAIAGQLTSAISVATFTLPDATSPRSDIRAGGAMLAFARDGEESPLLAVSATRCRYRWRVDRGRNSR
jgi:hypothetical protein